MQRIALFSSGIQLKLLSIILFFELFLIVLFPLILHPNTFISSLFLFLLLFIFLILILLLIIFFLSFLFFVEFPLVILLLKLSFWPKVKVLPKSALSIFFLLFFSFSLLLFLKSLFLFFSSFLFDILLFKLLF